MANAMLRNTVSGLQSELAETKAAAAEAARSASAVEGEKKKAEREEERLRRELETTAADVGTWRRRHEELVAQRSQLESAQVAELRKELKDKEARIDELAKLGPALAAKEDALTNAVALAAKERERLEGEVADQKSKAIDLGQKMESMENDLAKEKKTLQQARQLAIKYKNMYKEAEEKIKKGVVGGVAGSAPVSESGSAESVASAGAAVAAKTAEIDAQKKEMEAKLSAAAAEAEKLLQSHKTETAELAQRLTLLEASNSQSKKALADVGKRLAEANEEKNRLATQITQLTSQGAEKEAVERELDETKRRLALMETLQRRQAEASKRAADPPRSGPAEEEKVPVVQPVVPQPLQSPAAPSDDILPQPGGARFQPRQRRQPPVASVQPTGGRPRAQQVGLVPPSVSPGPTLPDQSSSSVSASTGPAQAAVLPMHMAVSTSTTAATHPPPVPHAVVSPHHPQQEQVSGSSDVVSAGPGTSGATAFRSVFGGSAAPGPSDSSLPSRKRALPTGTAAPGSTSSSQDKRLRSSSPEQVPFLLLL